MSSKVSSSMKGPGGGNNKRLNTKIINKSKVAKGKTTTKAGGPSSFPPKPQPDLRLTDEDQDVQVVPPSSPVPPDDIEEEDEALQHPLSPEDPATRLDPGQEPPTPGDLEDDDIDDSCLEEEDCEDEEESCSDEVEEEEDDDEEGHYEEEDDEDDEEEDEVEDRTRPGPPSALSLSRRPMPQHRPQLPISERAHKRRGRTPGSSAVGTSASKKARGGLRGSKISSAGGATCSNVQTGNCKSLVSNLRKTRRPCVPNPNPIFVHNTSSSSEEEEEDDEDDEEEEDEDEEDGGDEYLERDESDEEDDEDALEPSGFLLPADGDPTGIQSIPPDAQARLEAFFEAAGFTDGKLMSDPESLRKLTLTVSSALGEASAAINRMRDSQRKSIEEGRSDSMEEGDSLLALACSSGYFELARVLLAMGANVDDRGSKGDLTPLMDAASQGHVEIVRLLMSHNADVNAQSACGNSALMYACSAGHEDVVQELLKIGANVEDNNENGHTPLMEAASAGHVNVAKILLEHGAGINTHSNEFKESALTVACYKGHLDMVRYLLGAGADQQHKTDEMHTALMEASMDGHVEVARLLLDSGAQVNMPADSFESPLTLAACGGHVELAELLLERGANIEEVNDEGYTPLMEAAREGHLCVVRTLLKHEAFINAQTDETHETALTLAACGGFLDVVDTLVKSGADIELGGSTPLMESSQEGHLQVVRYMLERGADINHQTVSGDTALSFACENGHLEVAQLLVDMGSDPEHLSDGGRTPLMKACRGGHVEVIKYLLGKKADVNRQTATNDHTPLSLACAGGHLAAVEVLLLAGANPFHKLKDNSTMVIEAARGGHMPVIKCLLDYAPPGMAKNHQLVGKGQIPAKQGAKGAAANQKTTDAGKAPFTTVRPQPITSSMLRKSRSTSTLDTTAPPQQQQQQAKDATGEDCKVKVKVQVQVTDEASKSSPGITVDATTVESSEGERTTLPSQNLTSSNLENVPLTVTDGGKPSSAQDTTSKALSPPSASVATVPATKKAASAFPGIVKRPAGSEPVFTPLPQSPQSPTPSGSDSVTAGTITLISGSAFSPVSSTAVPVGPPLVPSQVTADTAISERPKAKANKPSARKQVQLQQQLQQLQQQVGQSPTPSQGTSSCETSPGSSSDRSQVTPVGSPISSPLPLNTAGALSAALPTVKVTLSSQPGPPGSITAAVQQHVLNNPPGGCGVGSHVKLDAKQLSQIFAQHHQQQFLKSKAGTASAGPTSTLTSTPLPSSSDGIVSTNTTTTVVVTHGNGETETIIEGDSVAAAAFPLDYMPIPGSLTMNAAGEILMQMTGPGGEAVTSVIGASQLASTPTQTTLTGSGTSGLGTFPPQMVLPHPPPLPSCIAAAAAAAGLVPASGAPPPAKTLGAGSGTASKKEPHASQKTTTVSGSKCSAASTSGPAPIPVNQVPPVASLAAPVGQKKQLAKRSRPFSQQQQPCGGSGPRQSNQQTQTHTHTHTHSHSHTVGMKQNQSVASTQTTLTGQHAEKAAAAAAKHFDVNSATESNGESSLSIAAGAGHYEVVEFLLQKNARIEHRDKKGCTPLILAADGGHDKVVELLLNSGAEIEAQSERTKDTALSLACTKGKYEVVDLLLKKGANKEHRNVSDYTPLSLAASGGYVNIIKLLLQNGAEINSRTGSKLGISPLMLAAMNGNTAAVKLLLDMGSDINAQIETNKNTALTLACFQGRQEVVSLLLDRKANLEHRAKTGLTPLMEAANGGYTEVGKILIERGADVNAPPVPATKDTALTIAADKGHFRFVELLLQRNAVVEVRNKKGCTPLWLACHGGHLDVAQVLFKNRADLDVQDNRRVSCLMAAFRKGHVKVIRFIVKNVQQFPSDGEMVRYYTSIQGEPELLKKCQQCGEFIKQAKDKQALEANKNASILLEELDMERSREESKRQAAARRREKKKKKKQEKKQLPSGEMEDDDDDQDDDDDGVNIGDSGIDANSLGSNSSGADNQIVGDRKNNKENVSEKLEEKEEPAPSAPSAKSRKKKNRRDRERQGQSSLPSAPADDKLHDKKPILTTNKDILKEKENKMTEEEPKALPKGKDKRPKREYDETKDKKVDESQAKPTQSSPAVSKKSGKPSPAETSKDVHFPEPLMGIALHPASHTRKNAAAFDSHEPSMAPAGSTHSHSHPISGSTNSGGKTGSANLGGTGQLRTNSGRKDDGWKEVTRSCPSARSKKVIVPSSVISRVIGRGGCNINAIREATGAHIEVEKQQKGQCQPERTIQIKGTVESTKQAHTLITALMNEPDLDVKKLLPSSGPTPIVPHAAPFSGVFSVGAAVPATLANPRLPSSIGSTLASSTAATLPAQMIDTNPFTTFVSPAVMTGKGIAGKSHKAPASPPVVNSVSPPAQKPATPVNGSPASYKATATQHTKKSAVLFTQSKTSGTSIGTVGSTGSSTVPASSFGAKQQPGTTTFSQYSQQTQRTTSPNKATTPTFGGPRATSTPTPPPASTSPTGNQLGHNQHKGGGYIAPASAMPMTASVQSYGSSSPLGSITSPGQRLQGKETLLNRAPGSQSGVQNYIAQQQAHAPVSGIPTQPLNLAPGSSTSSSIIAPPGSRPVPSTESNDGPNARQNQPLEYSPFSYTFNKSAVWFPGDLAHPSLQQPGSSINHTESGLNLNPLSSGMSSVARAMNFASVAASGISSSTISTASAQMSQGGGLLNGNGGLVGSLGLGLASSISSLSGKGIPEPLLESEMPKADASKAPGYRGTNMGSPVLRMSAHQQPQHIPSGFGMENYSPPGGSGGMMPGGSSPGYMNSGSGGRVGSMNMNSQMGLGGSGNWGQDMGPGIMTQQSGNNPIGFPNNRLNPRAQSFSLSQHSKMGPPGSQPNVSAFPQQQQQQQAFAFAQQQQQHNMPGPFKGNSFGQRSNNNIPPPSGRQGGVGPGMNMSGGWSSYSNEAVDLQGLAVLAGPTGTIDPQVLFGGMDSMQDNQNAMKGDDRRLPRPIGGERAWKNSSSSGSGGNLSNMAPFSALDCLDSAQLPQPMSIQQQQHHAQGGNNWLTGSVYGMSSQQYPSSSQQGPPHHSNVNSIHGPHTQPQRGPDVRNFLGRRFMEDMDPNRIVELQQIFDGQQQRHNGGPGMMHLGGNPQPPMYPFGPPDHLEPPPHIPKVDQHNNWDSHIQMDDKHNMGWNSKWGN